jgi:hypothetical protein
MDISTTRIEEHEIAKTEDFEFAFQSIIRNTALLDRMLVSANSDYLVAAALYPNALGWTPSLYNRLYAQRV